MIWQELRNFGGPRRDADRTDTDAARSCPLAASSDRRHDGHGAGCYGDDARHARSLAVRRHCWPAVDRMGEDGMPVDGFVPLFQANVSAVDRIAMLKAVERTIGIEPTTPGWKPSALPLSYVRERRT